MVKSCSDEDEDTLIEEATPAPSDSCTPESRIPELRIWTSDLGTLGRKGSARALETRIDIVCEEGFTEENRDPQHVWAYIPV